MIVEYDHETQTLTIPCPHGGTDIILNSEVVARLFSDDNLHYLANWPSPAKVSLRARFLFPDVAHQP